MGECEVGGVMAVMTQCVTFPPDVDRLQCVQSVNVSPDGQLVLVVTGPLGPGPRPTGPSKPSREESGAARAGPGVGMGPGRSCLLVYRVVAGPESLRLDEAPLCVRVMEARRGSVLSATMLPQDVCEGGGEGRRVTFPHATDRHQAAVVTTGDGGVEVISLSDLSTLARWEGLEGRGYAGSTYCCGIDKLCAFTRDGRLHFFSVGPRFNDLSTDPFIVSRAAAFASEDIVDGGGASVGEASGGEGLQGEVLQGKMLKAERVKWQRNHLAQNSVRIFRSKLGLIFYQI